MIEVLAMSAASVAACLITLNRLMKWKRIMRHRTAVDVGFTVVLGTFLAGTLTGGLVAILGGLFMALTLTVVHCAQSILGRVKAEPAMRDDEHDADGNWIYNQAPYV